MNAQRLRKSPNIAIVGSTSLLGKELQDVLEGRGLSLGRLTLLETEEYAGLLQEFAGEIQITQVISPRAFDNIDIAFFACSLEIMQAYMASGAAFSFPSLTIDLTQAGKEGTLYLDGISDSRLLRPQGYFVNPHPAAIVIGRILSDLHNTFAVQAATVTILEPASQRGNAGVDELQEQTVSLLNFQQVEKKVFSGQLAFNILPEQEASSRTESRIIEQLDVILGKTVPKPVVSALQVPVFHSHAFSMSVRLLELPTVEDLLGHFGRKPEFAVSDSSGGPSPVGVVGSNKIHIGRVRAVEPGLYTIFAVADNLRIAATNAVQTAEHIILAPALDA